MRTAYLLSSTSPIASKRELRRKGTASLCINGTRRQSDIREQPWSPLLPLALVSGDIRFMLERQRDLVKPTAPAALATPVEMVEASPTGFHEDWQTARVRSAPLPTGRYCCGGGTNREGNYTIANLEIIVLPSGRSGSPHRENPRISSWPSAGVPYGWSVVVWISGVPPDRRAGSCLRFPPCRPRTIATYRCSPS